MTFLERRRRWWGRVMDGWVGGSGSLGMGLLGLTCTGGVQVKAGGLDAQSEVDSPSPL